MHCVSSADTPPHSSTVACVAQGFVPPPRITYHSASKGQAPERFSRLHGKKARPGPESGRGQAGPGAQTRPPEGAGVPAGHPESHRPQTATPGRLTRETASGKSTHIISLFTLPWRSRLVNQQPTEGHFSRGWWIPRGSGESAVPQQGASLSSSPWCPGRPWCLRQASPSPAFLG